MKRGISTNRALSANQIAALRAAGCEFVFRYYAAESTGMPAKILRPDEARRLAEAGMTIGTVYELGGGAGGRIGDFAATKAKRDAAAALAQAAAAKQPTGSAIYFAVDSDYTEDADVTGPILNYFVVIADELAKAGKAYPLGVYGSGFVCRLIRARCPAVKYAWLAESTGWKESRTYNGWDVKQFVSTAPFGGLPKGAYEHCDAEDDFGGWQPGVAITPEAGPRPAKIVFEMTLGPSSTLLQGTLSVLASNGTPLLQVSATSGQPSQQRPEMLWVSGEGPLPNVSGLRLSTRAVAVETTRFKGPHLAILPDTVRGPLPGQERGGFGLHSAETMAGTRGAIAVRSATEFNALAALLERASKSDLPLEVVYRDAGGALVGAPEAPAVPAKAVFAMKLKKTTALLTGTLTLLDQRGATVFSVAARSGLAGFQHRDALWVVQQGAIPDVAAAKTLLTAEAADDHLGPKFFITPEVFKKPDSTQTRSAFRVHFDQGDNGSAGCIVLPSEEDFAALRAVMRQCQAARPKVASLPLDIVYS